jgi:alpha-ketoglutarate-dependent taurine dioxygenase
VDPYAHSSGSFAWKADSFPQSSLYTVAAGSDLSKAYEEVRSGRGFVVVRGLPVDGALEDFVEAVRELGSHFGHPLSQNAQGETVGHVVDATKDDPTPRMYRSNLELRPHTDIAAMISLACWHKAQSGGASVIVSAVAVHDEIRRREPRLLGPLYRGYHYHRLGEQAPDEETATPYRVPVFSIRDKQLSCRYQRTNIAAGQRERGVPLTGEDIEALNLFDEVARAPQNRLSFYLERGDMIVINNYTVMHARTEFRNFPEPERERRLIRLWLDREDFRDVPKELNLFKANGVPKQEGAACSFDFRKLYSEDPVGTGGVPKILS